MKKILYSSIIALLFVATSCADFTDITPKGKNMLQSTDDLEQLLNADMYFSGASDFYQMAGDAIYAYSSVAAVINAEKKSKSSIIWTWDEDLDKLAELTTSDYTYSDLYEAIGKIANPVLSGADAATGAQAAKNQLKAEAYCLRGWALYCLVNKYAKAYNPSTAATDPAIPVYLENDDIAEFCDQWTVKQVYDQIVADAQAAIDLDALPVKNINRSRMCSACPYAIKAMALLAMQDYDGAEAAAKASLAINPNVCDYNTAAYQQTLGTYTCISRPLFSCEEDLFQTVAYEYFHSVRPEFLNSLEDGHAVKDKLPLIEMMLGVYPYMTYDALTGMTGLNWFITYDMGGDSYWNDYGIKTTHMYLTVAECELEKKGGSVDEAMKALDAIRVCRIETGKYAPLQGNVTTKSEAISYVKKTSDGENWNTVYGFINRKRWNQLSDWKQDYTKTILGKTYTLSPDSKLWIFPFPQNALQNPNVKQNYDR